MSLALKLNIIVDPAPPIAGPIISNDPGGFSGFDQTRFWNRLESRPRNQDFENTLKAEINDPLFMLTRQWQFGEFNSSDTGTSILAKLELQTTKLSRFQSHSGAVQAYLESMPLEVQVERQSIELSFKERAVIGDFLVKQLKINRPSDYVIVVDALLSLFTFSIPTINLSTMDDIEIVKISKLLSNVKLTQFLTLVSGRKIDGKLVLDHIDSNIIMNGSIDSTATNTKLNSFISSLSGVTTAMKPDINKAIKDFYKWYYKLYTVPNETKSENSWDSNKLEYKFDVSTPEFNINDTRQKNAILSSEEYYNGRLDWHSFVKKETTTDSDLNQITNLSEFSSENTTPIKHSLTVLPSLAKFPGMPSNRFWQFEDGSINFGKIEADTADIAKILFAEFALVYQDDFLLVPYDVPVGSSSKVLGIVLTDVFGVKTYIKHASESNSNNWESWQNWNMFNLTSENNIPGRYPADTRIFIPPTLMQTHESEPIEKIIFLRDEMSNLVWAIEKNVSDKLGGNIEGYKSINDLRNYLSTLRPVTETQQNETESNRLKYKLGNYVSENWIPFTPVQLPTGNRKNRLQRASMPFILDNFEPIPVRPQTSLLRKSIGDDDKLISNSSNSNDPRYFIFEEEITRSGIEVVTNLQRTRWINGKTFLWRGNKKLNGRGEGYSGLEFDRVIE